MRSAEEILMAFKITSTPQRHELLNIMLHCEGPFSLAELKQETEKALIVISEGTIVQTLLLFEMRHLIVGRPEERTEKKKGRPPMQYTVSTKVRG